MADFSDNKNMAVKQENFLIFTLNYVLKFLNGKLASREKKEFVKPFEYLSKYLYAIKDLDECQNKESKRSDTIWQCWLQGEDKMPDLVRVCTQSVKKYNPNHEIVIITEENCKDYINLPDYVIEKYKKNIIPPAQFSDIIRFMLLEKYGGVWIDSTIYETGKLPEETFSSDFFTYKNTLGLCFEYIKNIQDLKIMCNYLNCSLMLPSTWFVSSASNNIIISGWLKLILEYWKNEDILVDYYILDYFFVLLLLNNKKCRQIFTDIPPYLTTPVFLMQSAVPEEYDEELYENIKSMSTIHKLTLKYSPDETIKNRLYNKIVHC